MLIINIRASNQRQKQTIDMITNSKEPTNEQIKTTTKLQVTKRIEFPYILDDYIGQQLARSVLKLNLFNKKFSPVIYSKPGMGKSLLLELFCIERNRHLFAENQKNNINNRLGEIVRTEGGSLSLYNTAELVMCLEENDILFIDEIHRMSMPIAERFLSVIQDKMMFGIDPRNFMTKAKELIRDKYLEGLMSGRITKRGVLIDIQIPDSIMICGATTELGMMPKPLLDRMFPIRLTNYSIEEMHELVLKTYHKFQFEPHALDLIVTNSQFIPRLAKRMIVAINPEQKNLKTITTSDIEQSLKFLEIYKGLSYTQRKYLSFIYSESPVGRKTISDYLGIALSELDNVVEPWLKENGWIKISSRGRSITTIGKEFVDKELLGII